MWCSRPCNDLLALPAAFCLQSLQPFALGAARTAFGPPFSGDFQVLFVAVFVPIKTFVNQPPHQFACFLSINFVGPNSLRIKFTACSVGFDITAASSLQAIGNTSGSALFRSIQLDLGFVQPSFCAPELNFCPCAVDFDRPLIFFSRSSSDFRSVRSISDCFAWT